MLGVNTHTKKHLMILSFFFSFVSRTLSHSLSRHRHVLFVFLRHSPQRVKQKLTTGGAKAKKCSVGIARTNMFLDTHTMIMIYIGMCMVLVRHNN